VIHKDLAEILGLTDRYVDHVTKIAVGEIERRRRQLGADSVPAVADRAVVLVDDGVVTGATARVGAEVLRQSGAARILLAVPVAAPSALARIRPLVDDIVCLLEPRQVYWVGDWYESFPPVDDAEVRRLVAAAGDTQLRSAERVLRAAVASPD
jgi:putative phosphoribosyl transferase